MIDDELKLFLDKIKPAILEDEEFFIMKNVDINKYYNIKIRGSILLSYFPLPEKIDDTAELGKILGYYPISCDEFEHEKHLPFEFLHFNGIVFNTCGHYDDCVKWCLEQYGDKILKKYGKLRYMRTINKIHEKGYIEHYLDRNSFTRIYN